MNISTIKVLWLSFVAILLSTSMYAEGLKVLAGPTLPITFEDTSLTYEPTGFGDATFNAIPTAIIDNPDQSGENTSMRVWSINKTEGAQIWAGASMNLEDTLNLSESSVYTIKVWSHRAGVKIRLKVEDVDSPLDNDGNPTIFSEVDATTTMVESWETLTFNLAEASTYSVTHSYERIALFPDFGEMGVATGEEYFFDDIMQAPPAPGVPSIPVTFEDTSLAYAPVGFGDATFNPIPTEIIDNPDQSGENTSMRVWSITKSEGAQVWAGASMNLSDTLKLSESPVYTIKVWSHRAGVTIRLKVEDVDSPPDNDGNPTIFSEVDAMTTAVEAWETLTFNLASATTYSISHSYERLAIFPDFGVMGAAGGETFYFDDIMQAAPVEQAKLPLDFESENIAYSPTGFGDATFNPIPTAIIDNPDQSGMNTSARVWEITKTANAQDWAGANVLLGETIDLTPGAVFSLKVWSPRSGVPVLLKLEDTTSPKDGNGNPTVFVELEATTTSSESWEVLSYDMAAATGFNASHMYNNVVVFPNFGNSIAGDEIYYFDDVINVNAVSIDPELFEGTTFELYPNPATSVVAIDYHLPKAGNLNFQILDLAGRKIQELSAGMKASGDHVQNIELNPVQSGMYIVLMSFEGEIVKQSKLIIRK